MNTKKCCNQNCNQGRDCPLRVSHRSLAEEITEGFEALKRIRELEAECDRLYRIIELDEREELKVTVRSFFEDFIDIREESDSGRVFAPITISSCRCMMIEPLAEVLAKMRTLSGATDAQNQKVLERIANERCGGK